MINYIVIGGGWRAEFYLRVAQLLPELFHVSAVCARNPKRAEYISGRFHVNVVSTLEKALNAPFDFIVNCINKEEVTDLSVRLADSGYFVLSETPITKEPKDGHDYEKIQVAEQFHLKGTYKAIKKIIDSALIGKVRHINISIAHDYHAMSLVRFFLNDYTKPELLNEHIFGNTVFKTNDRDGMRKVKEAENSVQKIRIYKFKNATVLYDFDKEQYFSPIRKGRLLIRGERGEIENKCVRYLNLKNESVCSDIKFVAAGLLDGFYNDKITFEDKTLFKFPFRTARLSEEESAIADCLIGMSNYIKTGKELYSYQRAYEDCSF